MKQFYLLNPPQQAHFCPVIAPFIMEWSLVRRDSVTRRSVSSFQTCLIKENEPGDFGRRCLIKKINTALIQLQLLVGRMTDGWLGCCVVIQSDKIHSLGQNAHTHTHRCLKMPHRKIHLMVLSEDKRMMKQFNLVEIDCNSPRLARWFQSFAKSYFANTLHRVLSRRVIYQTPVMRSRSHEWSRIIGPITPSFTSPSSQLL